MRAARDAVDDVDVAGGAPWCDSFRIQQCAREAVEKANRLAQIKSDRCYPYALRARARVAAGEKTLALKELQAAVDVVSDRIVCLQALEETALASGDRPLAQATLEQIVRAGCNDDESCAKALGWAASQQEASGSRGAALALYKRAHDRVPDDDTFLQNVARLAAETGRHAEAADAYDDLGKHHPTDPRWSTAAAEERRAALRSTLKL
jgi:tetratricopeptide (TPR) repeat protein